jgi:hypothetical protein
LVVLEAPADAAVGVGVRVERERPVLDDDPNGFGRAIVQWAPPVADATTPGPAVAGWIADRPMIAASAASLRACMRSSSDSGRDRPAAVPSAS